MIKKNNYLIIVAYLFLANVLVMAQTEPVMYFCERYDEFEGEVGIGSTFSEGPVTIIIRCDFALNLNTIAIQFDKYSFIENKFVYYKKAKFEVDENTNYLSFNMNDEKNMEFEDPGFYRVFLLDEDGKTISSGLVEILD